MSHNPPTRQENLHPDVLRLAQSVAKLAGALAGSPRTNVTPETWLSTSELAKLVGKDQSTVRRWITEHGLRAKGLPGGSYSIRYADFVEWSPLTGESSKETIRQEAKRVLERIA